LSGDTDKQKIPALTALHAQPYEEIAPLIPYLQRSLHEEGRIMNLIQEVLFVYRHLPIDEKINLRLRVLWLYEKRTTVVYKTISNKQKYTAKEVVQ